MMFERVLGEQFRQHCVHDVLGMTRRLDLLGLGDPGLAAWGVSAEARVFISINPLTRSGWRAAIESVT